jgi:hypothetical protein
VTTQAIEITVFLFLAGGFAAVAAWQVLFGEPVPSRWRVLADLCGLTDVERQGKFSHDLRGRAGALEVNLGEHTIRKGVQGGQVVIRGISPFLGLKREGLGSRIGKVLGAGEVETGDAAFDRAFYVQGDELSTRAVLNAETRRLVTEAFDGRFDLSRAEPTACLLRIGNSEVQAQFHDPLDEGREPRPTSVKALIALAGRLREPDERMARLARNASKDPVPEVRRRVLRTLERVAPEEPSTRAAMERAARSDPDGHVRLLAALFLDRDGWPVLQELAGDAKVDDAVSARAIEGLGERLPFDSARRILEEARPAARELTAAAAAVVLGRSGPAAVPSLRSALESGNPTIAAAAARALGRTGSGEAEAPLIAALGRSEEAVQAAAAEALGAVGAASSILPLKELCLATRGVPYERATDALLLIRARLTGVDPGRLALADGGEGQLALTADERGRLAVPEGDDTR